MSFKFLLFYSLLSRLTAICVLISFAAPEVLRGARYGGKETDIWAIGVLGYVIIIG